MTLTFQVSLRRGGHAQGRLKWPAKGLESAAVSGPHGNGALPDGYYLAKKRGLIGKDGQSAYCDSLNSCWLQYLEPQFSTQRTDLGVHPDGNVAGTAGCIGLLDADCSPWRAAFSSLTADAGLTVTTAAEAPVSLTDSLSWDASLDTDIAEAFSPALVKAGLTTTAWPKDTQAELESFYGKHTLDATGRPTAAWEKQHIAKLKLPYPMTLAWDLSKTVRAIRSHTLVHDSLERILSAILSHYGALADVQRNRMHLFGGTYNYRPISGSTRLSTHSWGAGIDLDPERNPLGKKWNAQDGMMPLEVVKIFEAEGWKWGGRFTSRPDCMHFQATR